MPGSGLCRNIVQTCSAKASTCGLARRSGGELGSRHRREVDLYAYTEDIGALHDRIKDRIEIIKSPHNMFDGMREVIVRDLNGFWITFGQEVPAEVLTPWGSGS